MVAEQRYIRRSEGRQAAGRQVAPPSHRVWVPASLEPAGAGGSRLSDGGTGGSESQRDKDSTKTGHRLTVRAEAESRCTVAAVFHISTLLPLPAAILSGQ